MKSQLNKSERNASRYKGLYGALLLHLAFLASVLLPFSVLADTVLLYSSSNQIYGVNLDSGDENLITSASLSPTVNALAVNSRHGLVYYGDNTSIYYWDASLGTGPGSHALINNFENGFFTAPIHNLNSTGGSFLNGSYYIGSEDDNGFIEELYELTMSADGRQIADVRALNLHTACACNKFQLGGFGDIAVIDSTGGPVIYGSSTDLTRDGQGTHAGIWRFELSNNNWELLANGVGGQLAASLDGRVFTNVGNNISRVDLNSGVTTGQTFHTTRSAIWDFTGAFSYDFGDAPDSYGAAMHLDDGQDLSIYVGALKPDNESYSQHSGVGGEDGLGDNQNGVNDEDALGYIPELSIGDTDFSIQIDCSSGYVSAWLDFNLNGQFDFNERSTAYPTQCIGGNANLSWSGFNITSAGTSYLRIRTASVAAEISRPTGMASSGEVEDHEVTLLGTSIMSGNCPAGSVSHVYRSKDVPKNYQGRGWYSSVIDVPDSLVITDLNVLSFNATHRTQNGLYFFLRKDNTTRRLYANTCRANQGFTMGFDDEAISAPLCPPVAGTFYRPTQRLSVYDSTNASGEWELLFYNRLGSNSGSINNWELEVCAEGVVNTVADIRLGKIVDVNGRTVTVTLLIRNSGNTVLSNVDLTDNLDSVFGVGNHSMVSAPQVLDSPSSFIANSAYTGLSNADSLLVGLGTLQPGEEVRVQFSVEVAYDSNASGSSYFNQASVEALSAGSEFISDLSSTGLNLDIDEDIPTPISLNNGVKVSGVVFEDSSTELSTSHDGIQQVAEIGVSQRVVRVLDSATGNELASTLSLVDGSWSVDIDAAYINHPVEVVVSPATSTQFISESPLNSDASNADGRVTFVLLADSDRNVANVGIVSNPTLKLDQSANVEVGQSILYEHVYTASTHGRLKLFLMGTSSSLAGNSWSYNLYHDLDCDGVVNGADYTINAVIDVVYKQELCVLVEVSANANANAGDSLSIELSSTLNPTDPVSLSHSVSFNLQNKDITTLVSAGVGNLVLEKSVRNVTLGEQANASNSALPGHTLEYTIRYSNTGNGNVNDLVINDESPAFTQIESASAECVDTPASMDCSADVSGTQLKWIFNGVLSPSAVGQVRYRVVLD